MNKKDIWEWSYSAEYLVDYTCGASVGPLWGTQIWDQLPVRPFLGVQVSGPLVANLHELIPENQLSHHLPLLEY